VAKVNSCFAPIDRLSNILLKIINSSWACNQGPVFWFLKYFRWKNWQNNWRLHMYKSKQF
jgi:hypothetical protein